MDGWEDETQRVQLDSSLRKRRITNSGGRAYLLVLRGGPIGHTYSVDHGAVLGRGRDATVELRNNGVSREHAQIKPGEQEDEFTINDMNSRNGTWLNDTRLKDAAPIRDGDRIRVGEVWLKFVIRDIVEEQLHQAQRMEAIGRMAAGVAHDFNNLLAVILGGASFLRDRCGDKVDHVASDDLLSDIIDAAEQAAGLTRQLLSFSRQGDQHFTTTEFGEMIRETCKLATRTFDRNIEIETVIGESLWMLGDPGNLKQALLNLLLNGRDAMPEGGRLTVIAERVQDTPEGSSLPAGPYIRIVVQDTGEGIDEETQARVFEPFFTTKGFGKGTGLGLSTVYGIVARHGGEISLQSRVGAGATFTMWLPALESSVAAIPERNDVLAVQKNQRGLVLLVDDEEIVRRALARMLCDMGVDLLEASNGKEAVDIVKQHGSKLNLVVLDLVMPQMGGAEAFRHMRQLVPNLNILISSGYDEGRADELLAAGAIGFLNKPYSYAELSQMTAQALKAS